MPEFESTKFAAAVAKLVTRYGRGERFNREFAQLVFRYFGPKKTHRFDEVAFRVIDFDRVIVAEMFVLGGGLLTVEVEGEETRIVFDEEISELEVAPDWVTGGDHFVSGPPVH
jgi:hypothetical protein